MSEEPFLPYGRQSIDDDDVAAVLEVLRDPWLTQGPRVRDFEEALAAATGAAAVVAVNSGTAALHLAYKALGVGEGDTVVVPAITFVATANAAAHCGAQVVFADVDPESGVVTADTLAAAAAVARHAGAKPSAIAPVHLGGTPADMESIAELASELRVVVVEDACHALGASYVARGEISQVGSCAHGDASTFSFHPVKHITTGEGGAITFGDTEAAEAARRLRTHGIHADPQRFERSINDPFRGPWYYEMSSLGYNYRITDLQCALGISQLKRLASFVERRRQLAALYRTRLDEAGLSAVLRPLRARAGAQGSYHLYVVQLVAGAEEPPSELARRRASLHGWLREHSIGSQVHYIPVPWQPYWQREALGGMREFPGAALYYASSLSLPLFPDMVDSDVDRVVSCIRDWSTRTGNGRGA